MLGSPSNNGGLRMLAPPAPNDDRRVEFVALTAVQTERSEPSTPERGHPSHRTGLLGTPLPGPPGPRANASASTSSRVKPWIVLLQAAVFQLFLSLTHDGRSVMCGSFLDWVVLSVSLFIQVQLSACQCHRVFVAEGNPTAGL
ncbi:hypothetical protein GOODEAATRI_002332 [Goodea atripinnis]|uniref:Uncharacterized protein n=1 Tax=Goodea atripinnis TaxID=208336 RepID=A0ABV0NR67_9TELE